MANWLLIKPINQVQTVHNVIVADEIVAATYRVENQGEYDYVLDQSQYSPTPGMEWTYDPGEDEFAAPAIDYGALLTNQLNELHALLGAMLYNAALMEPNDVTVAVDNVITDLTSSFTANEADVYTAVTTVLINGG